MSTEATFRPRGLRQIAVLISCLPLVLLSAAAQETAASGKPPVTIKELMEKTITPATNTIWNAYDPPTTDEQWQALEEAAVTLIAASYVTSMGGSGPMDADWAKQPSWRAFNDVMMSAARDALTAVRARDHDALLVASDVLYPPCEGCHMQFNPGVVNAQ
jgi:cytochrome c556